MFDTLNSLKNSLFDVGSVAVNFLATNISKAAGYTFQVIGNGISYLPSTEKVSALAKSAFGRVSNIQVSKENLITTAVVGAGVYVVAKVASGFFAKKSDPKTV